MKPLIMQLFFPVSCYFLVGTNIFLIIVFLKTPTKSSSLCKTETRFITHTRHGEAYSLEQFNLECIYWSKSYCRNSGIALPILSLWTERGWFNFQAYVKSTSQLVYPCHGDRRGKGRPSYQSADDNSVINCIMYLIPVSEQRRVAVSFVTDTAALESWDRGSSRVDITMLIMHSIDHIGTAVAGSL